MMIFDLRIRVNFCIFEIVFSKDKYDLGLGWFISCPRGEKIIKLTKFAFRENRHRPFFFQSRIDTDTDRRRVST
jgi:hypothetical protein